MLPQIGSSELLLIAVIALIVVGPKDLPVLLRKVGQFIARLRGREALVIKPRKGFGGNSGNLSRASARFENELLFA